MKRTYYRVGEVADMLHVTPESVRAYVRAGKIHCDRTPSGQRVFTQEHIDAYLGNTHTPKHVFYARSSKGDRKAIQAQLDELEHTYGTPERTYTDSGSGLNENRRGLAQLIKDAQKHRYDTLYITYPDRLTRFGYTYLQELFNQNNITVIPLHSKSFSAEEELMQDFMSLIASFAGRFYRLRSRENQKKLLKAAENTINSGGAA